MSQTPEFYADKSTTVRVGSVFLRGLAGVAPELAAAGLELAFRSSRRFSIPERERRWLATAETGGVEVGGHRLTTWSWGRGPAVLLVHGWQGRGSQLGAFATPLCDAGFRAVTWDAPGHGGNPGRLSSLPQMIDAVVATAAKAGPVAGVVAHSLGAAAVTGAMDRGVEVGRAVFLAPPVDPGAFLAHAAAWLGLPPPIAERARRRIERRFAVRLDELAPIRQAPRMKAPLLVFHDRDDREVPWEDGSRLAATWPTARLVSTRGLGHRRPLRDPEVVAAAVEFLSRDLAGGETDADPGRSARAVAATG